MRGLLLALYILKQTKLFKSLLKNEFKEKLLSTLPPDVSLSQAGVWFQDDGQQGSLFLVYGQKGTRLRAVRQQQFLHCRAIFTPSTFIELFAQKKEKELLLIGGCAQKLFFKLIF